MTITRERPTTEDLASLLLLQQETEEIRDDNYYVARANRFLAAMEVKDDTE